MGNTNLVQLDVSQNGNLTKTDCSSYSQLAVIDFTTKLKWYWLNRCKGYVMKFLVWFNQVRQLAEQEQGLENWEVLGAWREYFLDGLSPAKALTKAKTDSL